MQAVLHIHRLDKAGTGTSPAPHYSAQLQDVCDSIWCAIPSDTIISSSGYVYDSFEIVESGHMTISVATLCLNMHWNILECLICPS
jgi:hypothetical protein